MENNLLILRGIVNTLNNNLRVHNKIGRFHYVESYADEELNDAKILNLKFIWIHPKLKNDNKSYIILSYQNVIPNYILAQSKADNAIVLAKELERANFITDLFMYAAYANKSVLSDGRGKPLSVIPIKELLDEDNVINDINKIVK